MYQIISYKQTSRQQMVLAVLVAAIACMAARPERSIVRVCIYIYIYICIHTYIHTYILFCFAERLRRRCVVRGAPTVRIDSDTWRTRERSVRTAKDCVDLEGVQHHPLLPGTALSRSRRRGPQLPFRYLQGADTHTYIHAYTYIHTCIHTWVCIYIYIYIYI